MQELICSCSDVISNYDAAADDDPNNSNDILELEQEHLKCHRKTNNNNDLERQRSSLFIHRIIPNPLALFKTVAALLSLDHNPHHQSSKNFQQQQEFRENLQSYEHLYGAKQTTGTQAGLKWQMELKQRQQHTATCTKEQMLMMMEFHQNSYEIDNDITNSKYDSNLNRDNEGYDDVDHHHCYDRHNAINEYNNSQAIEENHSTQNGHNEKHEEDHVNTKANNEYCNPLSSTSSSTSSFMKVGHFYRQCKLKTFEKIKLNLITAHGNNGNGGITTSACNNATALQTILETENDSNNSPNSSGIYQLIDEKCKQNHNEDELSLKVTAAHAMKRQDVLPMANKFKLFDMPQLTHTGSNSSELSQSTLNSISKRIEFFEHANIPNGGIIKPKSSPNNIYSIYRSSGCGSGDQVHPLGNEIKFVKELIKPKEAGTSSMPIITSSTINATAASNSNHVTISCKSKFNTTSTSFLLRHDSQTLTIILSCVFIVTFLLLVFFPLPG